MLGQYLRISRPRHWIYLLGPFLVGVVASDTSGFFWPALAVFVFYFTFPANLLIYGINDIFDYKSKQNKSPDDLASPSMRWGLLSAIVLWNLPFCLVWLADDLPVAAKLSLAGFLFFGVFYSAWPLRAKTKPVLDSLFNVLYIFPGLFAYGLLEYQLPPWQIITAGALWCAAMHAYLAIPDIKDDKKAGYRTIATTFRPLGTLVFCMLCYIGVAVLTYPQLKLFSLGAGIFYLFIILITFVRVDPSQKFALQKLFPLINVLFGMGLIAYVMLIVK